MKQSYSYLLKSISLGLFLSLCSSLGHARVPYPAFMQEPWVRLGGPPGGLGYDIRMQPDNPDIMFVTDSGAGIFKSTDGGANWVPTNEGVESTPDNGILVFCATIDPHDPNTVWIGTQFTAQIYRSTDGGQSWERRDNGIIAVPGEHSVRGITVDPYDQNIVYAGLEEPIDLGDGISRTKGEVYRTTDSGQNWTRIWNGENLARYIWIDPRDTQKLFVSTGIFDRNAANSDSLGEGGGVGILRSDDGGQSWAVLDTDNGLGGLFCPSLFMHPENPDVLLAAVTNQEGDVQQAGAYVTRDGGDTWELSFGMSSAEAVEIATSDTSVWYAAAHDYICRSDDAGESWQEFFMRTAYRGSGVPIDLQVDPRDPYRIFVNSYGGGNMMSSDGGETWVDASSGYTGASILGIAVSPADDRMVLAGGNNATWLSTDGGENWRGTEIPGTASSGAVEIVTRRVGGESETYTLATGGFDDGSVYRSTDFGLNWESTQVVDLEAFEQGAGVPPETRYGARAFAYAPSNPQKVFVGYSERSVILFSWGEYKETSPGFFRSEDGGITWEQVQGLPFEDVSILTLAVHPFDEGILYASTMTGVYRSVTGGTSWDHLASLEEVVPLYPEEGLPPIYAVAIDPFNPEVVYAGSPRGGVFLSDDGGDTWAAAGVGMDPNEGIQDIVPDPSQPGVLYAHTRSSGVFVSTDSAGTWQKLDDGYPAGVGGGQLALSEDGSVLYAGTGVSGVYRLGTPGSVGVEGADDMPMPIEGIRLEQNYPNPFNPVTVIEYRLSGDADVKLQILNIRGQLLRTLVDKRQPAGSYKVYWDGRTASGSTVASGVYLYKLSASGYSKINKMVISR